MCLHSFPSATHRFAHMYKSVYLQKFLEHYSLVIEILFPCHGMDGCRHKRKALDREKQGSHMRS